MPTDRSAASRRPILADAERPPPVQFIVEEERLLQTIHERADNASKCHRASTSGHAMKKSPSTPEIAIGRRPESLRRRLAADEMQTADHRHAARALGSKCNEADARNRQGATVPRERQVL